MTKADLIDSLATDFELSKRQTGEIIDALLDEIKAALRAGDKVQLIPFGSFMVRDRNSVQPRPKFRRDPRDVSQDVECLDRLLLDE